MFDRYDAGEQAVLVHIYFTQDKDMEDLQEFESLVSSAGVEALQVITGSRKAPHPKYFVGEGKAVEIAEAVKATGASVVLFDHALSPAQERNLERLCECRVIDRTGLILDIFAQRARTHEGKLFLFPPSRAAACYDSETVLACSLCFRFPFFTKSKEKRIISSWASSGKAARIPRRSVKNVFLRKSLKARLMQLCALMVQNLLF